jgi:lipopolysaccharide transport system ATP-binding protein
MFPSVALLKGAYSLSAFLFCERGLHIYDNADHFIKVQISQHGIEQGLFHVPRVWRSFDQAPPKGFKERTPHLS